MFFASGVVATGTAVETAKKFHWQFIRCRHGDGDAAINVSLSSGPVVVFGRASHFWRDGLLFWMNSIAALLERTGGFPSFAETSTGMDYPAMWDEATFVAVRRELSGVEFRLFTNAIRATTWSIPRSPTDWLTVLRHLGVDISEDTFAARRKDGTYRQRRGSTKSVSLAIEDLPKAYSDELKANEIRTKSAVLR